MSETLLFGVFHSLLISFFTIILKVTENDNKHLIYFQYPPSDKIHEYLSTNR